MESFFKSLDLLNRHIVQDPFGGKINDADLLSQREWGVLALFQDLHQSRAAIQLVTRGFVHVRPELRECGQLPVLGQFQA